LYRQVLGERGVCVLAGGGGLVDLGFKGALVHVCPCSLRHSFVEFSHYGTPPPP